MFQSSPYPSLRTVRPTEKRRPKQESEQHTCMTSIDDDLSNAEKSGWQSGHLGMCRRPGGTLGLSQLSR
jgi:hypothetical protein